MQRVGALQGLSRREEKWNVTGAYFLEKEFNFAYGSEKDTLPSLLLARTRNVPKCFFPDLVWLYDLYDLYAMYT